MSEKSSRVELKRHDHSLFNRGAGKGKEVLWYVCKLLFFLTAIPFPSVFKVFLLRLFGATAGEAIVIRPKVNIQMPWKLTIGNYCWIGEEAYLLNYDQLTIGDNVCISQRAFLCAGNHNFRDPGFNFRPSAIRLEDGVWIGANAFIGPEVTIGTDTIVAAGAVITTSVESNAIYKGNPAVFTGKRWE